MATLRTCLMDFWCLFLSFVCFCAEVGGAELIAWSAHFESIYLYFLDRAKGTRTILAFINSSELGGCIDIYVINSLFLKKLLKALKFGGVPTYMIVTRIESEERNEVFLNETSIVITDHFPLQSIVHSRSSLADFL